MMSKFNKYLNYGKQAVIAILSLVVSVLVDEIIFTIIICYFGAGAMTNEQMKINRHK